MRNTLANSSGKLALALLVLALWLALLLPSLDRSYLQNVDELWHARTARSAVLDGQWWPLMLDGRPFFEKPPLLPWLGAATALLSGQTFASWPYRVWNTLGGALALASLIGLGWLADCFWGGLFAALLLGLQGDFVYHSRFFTMDTPFLGFSFLALMLMAWALGRPQPQRWGLWTAAGLALSVAFWCKSWFVLALFPAGSVALASVLPTGQRQPVLVRLGLPLLISALAWLALYTSWCGTDFLRQEWHDNLLGRLKGPRANFDWLAHLNFYGDWILRSSPAMLPLLLAAPLGLWPRLQGTARRRFVQTLAWCLSATWIVGLATVRAETMNYVIPLDASLALCLGLSLQEDLSQRTAEGLALLLIFCSLSTDHRLPEWLGLGGGAALGLGLAWSRWNDGPRASPGAMKAVAGAGALLLLMQCPDAVGLCFRPLDPHRELAPFIMGHQPPHPGDTLWAVNVPTWAVDFYSRYRVIHVSSLAQVPVGSAVLMFAPGGLRFTPAQAPPPKKAS